MFDMNLFLARSDRPCSHVWFQPSAGTLSEILETLLKATFREAGLIGTWAETEAIFCDSSPYFGRNFWQSLSASTGTRTFPFARNAAGAKILCSEFPTHIPIESAGALS